jgi:ATP-dependent DNA helicase RecG
VKRANVAELATSTQDQDPDSARGGIEELVEAGLVQAHGTGKGRSYTMSAHLYKQLGQAPEHIRQSAFDAEQQVQMVLRFVREHGSIRRGDVMRLCALSGDQATRLLQKLVEEGRIVRTGSKKGSVYTAAA